MITDGMATMRADRGVGLRLRRIFIPLIGALSLAIVVFGVVLVVRDRADSPLATVDGQPVTRAEVLFQAGLLHRTVENEIRNELQAGEQVDWLAGAEGQRPIDRLLSRALEAAIHDHELLRLAREHGLTDATGPDDLRAETADENQRRSDALRRGEVVYGLTEFDEAEYYAHAMTELRTRLLERLGDDPAGLLAVTAEEIAERYASEPDRWSANATTYRLTRVSASADAGASAAAQTLLRAAQASDLASFAEDHGLTVAPDQLAASTEGPGTPPERELLTELGTLAEGGFTAPRNERGSVVSYRFDGADVDHDAAIAEYAERIRAVIQTERLDELLTDRITMRDIVIRHDLLADISPEEAGL